MKSFLITIFLLSSFVLFGQITGNVYNDDNEPVEFATILNLNKKTSSITNINGFFCIDGNIGDSIRIQHLACYGEEFKVHSGEENYILKLKSINVDEITVTAKYAINVFKRSCINTFNKFENNYTVRAYFQYLSTINTDTSQIIDIDLDVVQKKHKNINRGEKLIPYKIQERNEFQSNTPFCRTRPLFIYINQIYDWANYLENARYLKSIDSLFLKLYFIGEEQKIEVVIQKKDSCLVSVTGFSTASLRTKTGNRLDIDKLYWTVKYAYKKEIAYLSEMSNILILNNPKNENDVLTFKQFYKVNESNLNRTDRRPKGHRIFDNLWEPRLIRNNYERKFWEQIPHENNMEIAIKNFAGLKYQKHKTKGNDKRTNSPMIKAYGLGIHK